MADSGGTYLACRLMFGDLREADALASLDLFEAKVMPGLAALTPV